MVATMSHDRVVAGRQDGPRDPRRQAEMAVPIAMWVTVHPGSVAVQQRIGGGSAHNPRREREPARALRQAGV